MQKITIAGHIGRDPEKRFTSTGQQVISFTVATNKRRGDKSETLWWRVTIFGDRFDKIISYLKKGSPVIVTGEFSLNEWTDNQGVVQKSLEVVADWVGFSPFGRPDSQQQEGAPASSQSGSMRSAPQQQQQYQPQQRSDHSIFGQGAPIDASEEEEPIPF